MVIYFVFIMAPKVIKRISETFINEDFFVKKDSTFAKNYT